MQAAWLKLSPPPSPLPLLSVSSSVRFPACLANRGIKLKSFPSRNFLRSGVPTEYSLKNSAASATRSVVTANPMDEKTTTAAEPGQETLHSFLSCEAGVDDEMVVLMGHIQTACKQIAARLASPSSVLKASSKPQGAAMQGINDSGRDVPKPLDIVSVVWRSVQLLHDGVGGLFKLVTRLLMLHFSFGFKVCLVHNLTALWDECFA